MQYDSESHEISARHAFFKLFVVGLILLICVVELDRRHGNVIALGRFLHPVHGVWNHHIPEFETQGTHQLGLSDLEHPVSIVVDENLIPHVFAESDHDLFEAQGYILASERLWEMEFLTRLAGGRLAEIFGERGLDFDIYFRRLGLPQSAATSSELMLQDPVTGPALKAYAKGVNALINSLDERHLPLEYRILDLRPEAWTPDKAALLLKFMAWSLAGHSNDVPLTRSFSRLAPSDFDDLFPLELINPDPIMPKGIAWKAHPRLPEAPEELFRANVGKFDGKLDGKLESAPKPNPDNGSNNWAVSAAKSVTGHPILANDIHLDLSLPNLWYEMQLVSPNQNVYGISLPGAPGIILGFNQKIAWGVTNGGDDVFDWYELRYRDSKKSEYLFDGAWRPVISREVSVKIRGRAPQPLILRETHFGPILYDETETPNSSRVGRGLAVRWSALDPSNELKSFMQIDRAGSVLDCRRAIEDFKTPSQNFLCADTNDIGMWHMGRFPIRWRGQGRLVGDGANPAYDWKGWIPADEVPQVVNPPRGFLSSANQPPTDSNYPYYLGWPFDVPFRGQRINEMLRGEDQAIGTHGKFSPQDLMHMQSDTLSISAREFMPLMVKAVETQKLDDEEKDALDILRTWDFRFQESSQGAPIYDAWQKRLITAIWGRVFPDPEAFAYPPLTRTLKLIETDPDSKWFDDPDTEKKETFKDLALSALRLAIDDVKEKSHTRDSRRWTWARYRPTHFDHLSKIPGLGSGNFSAGGQEQSVFANSGKHGPVWKLVVATGPDIKAWSVYPGGQSGDPSSRHYDDFLDAWRTGTMKEVIFLKSKDSADAKKYSSWTITPAPASGREHGAKGGQ